MPSQTFTHEASASASIDAVWESLDRPETWESIGGVDRVFDAEMDDQGRLQGFSFDTVAAGKRYVGTATPHARVEGERMAWKVQNSEIRGVTSVSLTPGAVGTIITVTLEVQSAGFLSSVFFPMIASAIGNGLPQAVEDFAAAFEHHD